MHGFEASSHEERCYLKKGTKDIQVMHAFPLFLTYNFLPDVQPSGSPGFWLVPDSHLV